MDTDTKDLLLTDEGYRHLKEGPEIMVYLMIDHFGGTLWHIQHSVNKGLIESTPKLISEMLLLNKTTEYCVTHAARFGVVFEEGVPLHKSESYWKWFRWWDAYYKPLSEDNAAFHELEDLLETGGDVGKFRPEGDWNE